MTLKLQPREHQVLQMLCDGLLVKQIGDILGISSRTCSHYITNARNRNQLKTGWQLLAVYAKEHHESTNQINPQQLRPYRPQDRNPEMVAAGVALRGRVVRLLGSRGHRSEPPRPDRDQDHPGFFPS